MCSVISTPFPSHRLASSALKSLQVDAELSPLVRRKFSLVKSKPDSARPSTSTLNSPGHVSNAASIPNSTASSAGTDDDGTKTILLTEYKAKTNRMLRVAVNGFMESLGVVLGVMEKLDVDVMAAKKAPIVTA